MLMWLSNGSSHVDTIQAASCVKMQAGVYTTRRLDHTVADAFWRHYWHRHGFGPPEGVLSEEPISMKDFFILHSTLLRTE